MKTFFDEESGKLFISYKNKTKQKPRGEMVRLEKEPSLLVLHPNTTLRYDKKGKYFARVQFDGNPPHWMKKFAETEGYILSVVQTSQGRGYSLIDNNKKVSAPTIKAQFYEWTKHWQENLDFLKNKIQDNLEVIEKNVRYFSNEYEEFGFFYEWDKCGKLVGCSYFNEKLNVNSWDKIDEEAQKRLVDFIDAITTERDYYPEQLLIEEDVTEIEIELNTVVETECDEEEIEFEEEDISINLANKESTESGEVEINKLSFTFNEDDEEEMNDESPLTNIVFVDDTNEETELIDDNPTEEHELKNEDELLSEDESEKNSVKPEETEIFKIATRSSKKDGIIEGQLLLF